MLFLTWQVLKLVIVVPSYKYLKRKYKLRKERNYEN